MEDEQDLVAALLRSMPPPDARGDFVARVNERIDATAGWLGLADFRAWTLGLAPAACALALIAVLWTSPSSTTSAPAASAAPAPATTFRPASSSDWQSDVSGDALLEAALTPNGGDGAR
jgi:hypothetical protein